MKRLNKYWIVVGVIALTLIIMGTGLQGVVAKDITLPGISEVAIVNGVENPVPVSGEVSVNGTADVNVTNESLIVDINNSPDNPLLVSDIGSDSRQSFSWMGDFTPDLPGTAKAYSESYIVPAGKRLVIEWVNAWAKFSTGNLFDPSTSLMMPAIDLYDPITGNKPYYLNIETYALPSMQVINVANESIKMVIDEGIHVTLVFFDFNSNALNYADKSFYVSGYLEDN